MTRVAEGPTEDGRGSPGEPRFSGKEVRRLVLEQSKRANVGHIGSALSVADIIAALYTDVLEIPAPGSPERDRFVMSKGHAALALYSALYLRGWLSKSDLDSYCADDSSLGIHPETSLVGVDFCTGSLGMGAGYGIGAALAARLQASPRRSFVLISDAECNEGSVWEAAQFAGHHRLSNLVVLVDDDGQQALGHTKDVLCPTSLADMWRACSWDVREVDGHDARGLSDLIRSLDFEAGPPHLIVARTTFGKGVSFMEGRIKWHYWPMSDEEYAQALAEIELMP